MPRAAPASYVRRWSDARIGLGAATVVIVCMVIVRNGTVTGGEESVFHAINDLPTAFDDPMFAVQILGGLLVPLVPAAVAGWLRRYRLAAALAAVIPLKLLVEKGVIKMLVERERPGSTLTDAVLRGDVQAEGLAFPSGHLIIAFAIAFLLAAYVRGPWIVVAFSVAFLVGVSRIYLGAHLPLDVVAGAATGIVIGATLNLVTGVPAPGPAYDRLPAT